jgi:hypothetical protein
MMALAQPSPDSTVTASMGQLAAQAPHSIQASDYNPQKSGPVDGNFKTLAFVAKALSDENRLRILLSVSYGKKSVSSIVEHLDLS